MNYRLMAKTLRASLSKPYVDIVFGARQTGKTTLLRGLLKPALFYNLADPRERTRLLSDPGVFMRECEALPESGSMQVVFVDEAQSVPSVFDAVQALYDSDHKRWKFVLCGSSARKLRKAGANLLPGRCILHKLHPLTLFERTGGAGFSPGTVLPVPSAPGKETLFPPAGIEERLAYGELPGVSLIKDKADREAILKSYSAIHLEEEIRREALVKDWGRFVNFLRLAAANSGMMVNYASIAKDAGITIPTVKSHYGLLEDMFIGFKVEAFSGSGYKTALSTPRFLFFDLGVRNATASIGLEDGSVVGNSAVGTLFEQWVGIELHKRIQHLGKGRLLYFRTKGGAEIDFIIDLDGELVPIEVKWTERPDIGDAKHLLSFMESERKAKKGYVVCRCPRPMKLSEKILAIPWQSI